MTDKKVRFLENISLLIVIHKKTKGPGVIEVIQKAPVY